MFEYPVEKLFELDLLPDCLIDQPMDSVDWSIAQAFIAYAAGDAFGAAHEFVTHHPSEISSVLLGKEGWPIGGVSDDTTLSLLTVDSIVEATPEFAAVRYLELLRESESTLRGLGPTTRFALGMKVKPEEIPFIGVSNGGMMRTALLGMLFNPEQATLREAWVRNSVAITHENPIAIRAALLLSERFSDAIAYGDLYELPRPPEDWTPSAQGVSIDPIETYNAVLFVASRSTSVEKAFLLACELGGDTDTVAALSGSLTSVRMRARSGLFDIPWLLDVMWEEIPQLKSALNLMISRRREWTK